MGLKFKTLQGRQYYVLDAVLLVEGVHAGSNGPLLYTANDLQQSAQFWNGRPVIVYHPAMGAAGTPDVFERQQVGTVFNTRWQPPRLTAELWVDAERLPLADYGKDVQDVVVAGRQLEVSTGLYTDNEPVDGQWHGKAYEYIARHHRPDHLALLPGKVGACSIADGCGSLITT